MSARQNLSAVINATADGDNTLIASPGAGNRLVVVGIFLSHIAGAGSAVVKSGAGGTNHLKFSTVVEKAFQYTGSRVDPVFVCDVATALFLNNPAGVDTFGAVNYYIEAA